MRRMRGILAMGLLLASTVAWAQKTDGLIVTAGDAELQLAIGEVKELTFSDEGLTVIKTDEATVELSAAWQIRFGEVETTGISPTEISDGKTKVQVYKVEGKLVKELLLSDLRVGDFPKGVYIIMCNGKSFKIKF